MTSKEFIFWLNGFVDAVEGIPTQFQWDLLKNKLSEVGEPITFPSGPITRDRGTWPNTTPWKNPFTGKSEAKQVYDGQKGSSITDSIITDGFIQDSSVTRAQPPFTLTTTSTAYVSGSNVSYTVNDK